MSVHMSVQPREPVLPFLQLAWPSFEDFCEELVAALPGILPQSVKRMGVEGDEQDGIDIFADDTDGLHRAYQSKRHKEFGPGKLKLAIEKTTYEASAVIIMIACRAGAKVRKVCSEHSKFDVWDARDLSRRVLEMPPQTARRLVQRFFGPAWVKDFLGQPIASAFIGGDEFFRGLLNPALPMHHTLPIVGREEHIAEIDEFLTSTDTQVTVLSGSGGAGKSRLLYEVWRRYEQSLQSGTAHNCSLVFLSPDVSLKSEHIDSLPHQRRVIVIDDAHRLAPDLGILLRLARTGDPETKLILATRPWAVEDLRRRIAESELHHSQVSLMSELGALTSTDRFTLAKNALGSREDLAEQLANATADCALLTVLGGHYLQKEPALFRGSILRGHIEFRKSVLDRFAEETEAKRPSLLEESKQRRLLEAVSALSPLPSDNGALLEETAQWIGLGSVEELRGMLERLVRAGVARRKGYLFRLVPDVLSDHFLRRACGRSAAGEQPASEMAAATKNFALAAFEAFPHGCARVIRNVAELDWMDSDKSASAILWEFLEEKFLEAPDIERVQILSCLENAAYFAPERVLNFVRRAIAAPATAEAPEELRRFVRTFKIGHEAVLRRLPAILKRVAHNIPFLDVAVDLLWELGRDQPGRLSSDIDHPIRILQDLAEYTPGKPFAVTQSLVNAAGRWLSQPGVHQHVHSPFDVAEVALKHHVQVYRNIGRNTVQIHEATVPQASVKSITTRVVELLQQAALSSDLKAAGRALKGLDDALNPHDGNQTPDDLESTQIPILERLLQIGQQHPHPLVKHMAIQSAARWAQIGWTLKVRIEAERVINAVTSSFDLRWQIALCGGTEFNYNPESELTIQDQRQRWSEAQSRLIQEAAVDFLQRVSKDDQLKLIEQALNDMKYLGLRAMPGYFLRPTMTQHPSLIRTLINLAIAKPSSAVATHVEAFVGLLVSKNPHEALDFTLRLCDSSNPAVRSQAVSLLRHFDWSNPSEQQFAALQGLLLDDDAAVAKTAAFTLWNIANHNSAAGVAIALGAANSTNEEVVDEIFGALIDSGVTLLQDERRAFLRKLSSARNLKGYWIRQFIANCAASCPAEIIELLIERFERDSGSLPDRYEPFPSDWDELDLTGAQSSPEFPLLLRRARDLVLREGSYNYFHGRTLFAALADGKQQTAIESIEEWIAQGTPRELVGAARLLGELEKGPVFRRAKLAARLLEAAVKTNAQTLKEVELALRGVDGRVQIFSGTPGEPYPYLVRQMRLARRLARCFATGSEAQRFYCKVASSAEGQIRKKMIKDEEDDDE